MAQNHAEPSADHDREFRHAACALARTVGVLADGIPRSDALRAAAQRVLDAAAQPDPIVERLKQAEARMQHAEETVQRAARLLFGSPAVEALNPEDMAGIDAHNLVSGATKLANRANEAEKQVAALEPDLAAIRDMVHVRPGQTLAEAMRVSVATWQSMVNDAHALAANGVSDAQRVVTEIGRLIVGRGEFGPCLNPGGIVEAASRLRAEFERLSTTKTPEHVQIEEECRKQWGEVSRLKDILRDCQRALGVIGVGTWQRECVLAKVPGLICDALASERSSRQNTIEMLQAELQQQRAAFDNLQAERNDLAAKATKADEEWRSLNACEKEIGKLRGAVGLLTTLHPSMEVNVLDPVGMAQKIVEKVRREMDGADKYVFDIGRALEGDEFGGCSSIESTVAAAREVLPKITALRRDLADARNKQKSLADAQQDAASLRKILDDIATASRETGKPNSMLHKDWIRALGERASGIGCCWLIEHPRQPKWIGRKSCGGLGWVEAVEAIRFLRREDATAMRDILARGGMLADADSNKYPVIEHGFFDFSKPSPQSAADEIGRLRNALRRAQPPITLPINPLSIAVVHRPGPWTTESDEWFVFQRVDDSPWCTMRWRLAPGVRMPGVVRQRDYGPVATPYIPTQQSQAWPPPVVNIVYPKDGEAMSAGATAAATAAAAADLFVGGDMLRFNKDATPTWCVPDDREKRIEAWRAGAMTVSLDKEPRQVKPNEKWVGRGEEMFAVTRAEIDHIVDIALGDE